MNSEKRACDIDEHDQKRIKMIRELDDKEEGMKERCRMNSMMQNE